MDRNSIYELQKIDCNCNNCHYFDRDLIKTKQLNNNEKIIANKIHYGYCKKLNKEVAEIANICLINTQNCFIHRNDFR